VARTNERRLPSHPLAQAARSAQVQATLRRGKKTGLTLRTRGSLKGKETAKDGSPRTSAKTLLARLPFAGDVREEGALICREDDPEAIPSCRSRPTADRPKKEFDERGSPARSGEVLDEGPWAGRRSAVT